MKFTSCSGTGKPPSRIITETRNYKLASGQDHELPGRGICPDCGRRIAYRDGIEMARHKETG